MALVISRILDISASWRGAVIIEFFILHNLVSGRKVRDKPPSPTRHSQRRKARSPPSYFRHTLKKLKESETRQVWTVIESTLLSICDLGHWICHSLDPWHLTRNSSLSKRDSSIKFIECEVIDWGWQVRPVLMTWLVKYLPCKPENLRSISRCHRESCVVHFLSQLMAGKPHPRSYDMYLHLPKHAIKRGNLGCCSCLVQTVETYIMSHRITGGEWREVTGETNLYSKHFYHPDKFEHLKHSILAYIQYPVNELTALWFSGNWRPQNWICA